MKLCKRLSLLSEQPRALSPEEKDKVIEVLHSERFIDSAPAEIVATLLDEGVYLCSERTMYRNLAQRNEVKERRNQSRHPKYEIPRLQANRPKPGLGLGH